MEHVTHTCAGPDPYPYSWVSMLADRGLVSMAEQLEVLFVVTFGREARYQILRRRGAIRESGGWQIWCLIHTWKVSMV